jgi:histidinol phosphatase-like enzyme
VSEINSVLSDNMEHIMGRFTATPSQEINQQSDNSFWPKEFTKEIIGIDRNVILEDILIMEREDIRPLPYSLEAIKIMRLKGHRVLIFFNEPLIYEGKITQAKVDELNTHLMQIFGQSGIQSIDGLYYSTSSIKEDLFSMPNNGMLKKAENELKVNFKKGYFVGGKIYDLKAGYSCGAKPILIETENYHETELKLKTFANRELKSKTKVFKTLLDFANSL